MKSKLIGIIIFLGVSFFRFPISIADQDDHPSNANNKGHDHSTHQHQEKQKGSSGNNKHRFHRQTSDGKVHHSHGRWPDPPKKYASKRKKDWNDVEAISRGRKIYLKFCVVCHGNEGHGDGPLAKSLPHAPADFTKHFHYSDGKGEGYMYWRVAEGGTIDPSLESKMPPYKYVLSEQESWDVLTFIHNAFHKTFKDTKK